MTLANTAKDYSKPHTKTIIPEGWLLADPFLLAGYWFKRSQVLNLYMDLQAEKIELAKMLLDTQDETLVQQIRALFKVRDKDFWDALPEHVKQGINKSREQAKNGELIPFDDILKEIESL